jgi:hypothetical protein
VSKGLLYQHQGLPSMKTCTLIDRSTAPFARVSQPHFVKQESDSALSMHCDLHFESQALDGAMIESEATPTRIMVVYLLNILEILKK